MRILAPPLADSQEPGAPESWWQRRCSKLSSHDGLVLFFLFSLSLYIFATWRTLRYFFDLLIDSNSHLIYILI